MNAPSGFATFGTIRFQRSASLTMSQGLQPFLAEIRCPLYPGPYPFRGTFAIAYGSRRIAFPDSRLAHVAFSVGADGAQYVTFFILTRQWKWVFGNIEGRYNERDATGALRKERRKNTQELAALLLAAMGESRFDARALPTGAYPAVDWYGTPRELLVELCNDYGCRPCFDPFANMVRIHKTGIGAPLPNLPSVTSESMEINPPEAPDVIRFEAGETRRDVAFKLEAVAAEADGEIKLIDDVSYKPKAGWSASLPPHFGNVAQESRDLARKWVYRAYRPKLPIKINGDKIEELARILPLSDKRVETGVVDVAKGKERLPAMVFGRFYDGGMRLHPSESTVITQYGKQRKYPRSFQVDAERGMVVFAEPVAEYWAGGVPLDSAAADPYKLEARPAKLYLLTSVAIRDADTFAYERYRQDLIPQMPKFASPPHVIRRDDVFLGHWQEWGKKGLVKNHDNEKDVKAQAAHYLQAELQQFQLTSPGARTYSGLEPIAVDGAINQVTISIDDSGVTQTSATRNTDLSLEMPTWQQRVERAKVRRLLETENRKRRGSDERTR